MTTPNDSTGQRRMLSEAQLCQRRDNAIALLAKYSRKHFPKMGKKGGSHPDHVVRLNNYPQRASR